MPQNVGSIRDLTSKNIHRVDTLNSPKLIVLRENKLFATSPKKGEKAVYGYDPALFLVLSVSC